MAIDYSNYSSGLESPAQDAVEITPSDTTPLTVPARALYVGGNGAVRARLVSGTIVTFPAMLGGIIYPVRVAQILDTGTTATGLVGLM